MTKLNEKQERLLDNFAESIVDAEEIYEKKKSSFSEILAELLSDPSKRDQEMFAIAALTLGPHVTELVEWTIEDFLEVPLAERTILTWAIPMSHLVAVCRAQASIESGIVLESIGVSDKYVAERHKLGKSLNESELREASKAGISKARVNGARERKVEKNGEE